MQKAIFYFLLFAVVRSGYAQVANYDFYAFRTGNMFNVNPAWVTKDEGINITLNSQIMGSSIGYAQKNIMAGIYSETGENSGLGLKVISDTRGAFEVLHTDLSYGFHARFSKGHSLRLGVLAGLNNSRINVNRLDSYELIDLSDRTLYSNYYNATQFVAGAGLLYSIRNFDIAASLPQIISTARPFNSYVNAAIFYTIKANDKLVVQPWFSYQRIPVTKALVGGYVKANYKDRLWAQAGYQNNKSFASAAGIFYENIGISYGVRLSNPEFREVAGSIHEIAFTVRIKQKKSKKNKSGEGSSGTDLDKIVSRIDNLLAQDIRTGNRSELLRELNAIKEMLSKAELDNADPEKAKLVEEQLAIIESKFRAIEEKLQP